MADNDVPQAYPRRLHHGVPAWVKPGAEFHIRMRAQVENPAPLVDPNIAAAILSSARHYHAAGRWWLTLMLLMPDHIHALVSFPPDMNLSRTVGDWKRFVSRKVGVVWQNNFFDHRLRTVQESAETFAYIMRNSAAKGLIGADERWPWLWAPHLE